MASDNAVIAKRRYPMIDAVRGVAIILMFAYHFSWDLDNLELADVPLFTHPFWLGLRFVILSSFLVLVGLSQVIARQRSAPTAASVRRWLLICAAAGAITLGTWLFLPNAFVFFGVLHCIAVSTVLVLAFVRAPWVLVLAGAVFCYTAPQWLAAPMFNAPEWQWLGLMTRDPVTVDYVPMLPWFGMVLLGVLVGRLLQRESAAQSAILSWDHPSRGWHALCWAGRHSLLLYLVHQPVFYGMLSVYVWLR